MTGILGGVRLPIFHQRLVEASRAVCGRYGLLLAGGYAMSAHGFTDRPSRDLDFATSGETPLPLVAEEVAQELRGHGFLVAVQESTPLSGRLEVADSYTEESCRIVLLREALQEPASVLEPCPVVGQDDAVGLKVRALHDRGLARDFIDVAAVSELYSFRELERLGAVHDDDFRTEDLLERLETVDALADEGFLGYGVDEDGLVRIRRFAYAWAEDIKLRRAEDGDTLRDPPDLPELD